MSDRKSRSVDAETKDVEPAAIPVAAVPEDALDGGKM
jgi:hypothetical protein